ncbi:hypothetical protein [Burkholderia sp. MSMB617WGS]|nr:hypothetical protein [Burkholderia sp. MSMB617WGS]
MATSACSEVIPSIRIAAPVAPDAPDALPHHAFIDGVVTAPCAWRASGAMKCLTFGVSSLEGTA